MMAKRERDKETPEEIRQAFRVFDKVVVLFEGIENRFWTFLIFLERAVSDDDVDNGLHYLNVYDFDEKVMLIVIMVNGWW